MGQSPINNSHIEVLQFNLEIVVSLEIGVKEEESRRSLVNTNYQGSLVFFFFGHSDGNVKSISNIQGGALKKSYIVFVYVCKI